MKASAWDSGVQVWVAPIQDPLNGPAEILISNTEDAAALKENPPVL